MSAEMLPAGYVNIGAAALHVAELRKHTKDVSRFLDYLADAQELCRHRPHSPEWLGVIEKSPDIEALQVTLAELGNLQIALADNLERELEARQ